MPILAPASARSGSRNVQRLMKLQNAAVGGLKAENLIDGKLIQQLDASGFIDHLYRAYGVKCYYNRFING